MTLLGVLVIIALVAYAWYASARSLVHDARAYSDAYGAYSDAAFLPGAAGNPVREAANRALAQVLTGTLSPAERLERSRDGRALLSEIEKEIDAIPEARARAEAAQASLLRHRYSLAGLWYLRSLSAVGGVAERQALAIDDIRGLSYGANYHTDKIFARLLEDGGVLDDAFVITLNAEIPQVEEQFNRRTNLYAELQQIDYEMATLLAGMGVPR